MQYRVGQKELTLYMTEVKIEDCFFEDYLECVEIYYTFSDALRSFVSRASRYGSNYFFASEAQENTITIMASPDKSSYAGNNEIDGPYKDPLVAYGVGRLKRINNEDYINQSKTQFSPGTHVIYYCYYDCDGHQYCKVDLLNNLTINLTPLNAVCGIKTGEHVVLRLLGYTDDVCVFDTAEALTKEMHLPSKAIIPIGTYSSDACDQDSSAVITGYVQEASLVSAKDKLRYSVTVKTHMAEVELNILTNYEIKKGKFLYAQINDLSARF